MFKAKNCALKFQICLFGYESKSQHFISICAYIQASRHPQRLLQGMGVEIISLFSRGPSGFRSGSTPKNKAGHQILQNHSDSCVFMPAPPPWLCLDGFSSSSRGPRYRSPRTRSLPVRNQRGSRGTHRVALRLLSLKPNSQVVLQDSSPSAFLRVQEGERDRTQASNASEPRARAEDTASRCALVPAEKVSNKAFVANKRQKTPHLSAFS